MGDGWDHCKLSVGTDVVLEPYMYESYCMNRADFIEEPVYHRVTA